MTQPWLEPCLTSLPGAGYDASKRLEFEYAAVLGDQIIALRGEKTS